MISGLKKAGVIVLRIMAFPLVLLLSLVFAVWLAVISTGLFVRKHVLLLAAGKQGEDQ